MVAVVAFAVTQPLLSIYPAETIGKQRALSAFRMRRIMANLGRIGGPLLAGYALARFSQQYAMVCVAALGCLVLPLALRLPALPAGRFAERSVSPSLRSYWRSALAGFVLKVRLPAERFFSLQDILLGIATAGIVPMLIPQWVKHAGLANSQVGWLTALFVVGSIGGVVVVHPLLSGVLQRRYGYLSVWAAFCIGLIAITASHAVGALGAALIATGAFGACLSMTGIDRRVIAIPPSVRIRVASATLLTGQLTSMSSFAFYGASYAWSNVGGRYGLYVGLACAAALAVRLAREPWWLLKQNDAEEDIETFYIRRYPKLFEENKHVRDHTVV